MIENVVDSILEFEWKNKINEREVLGLKYWSLIRTFVLNDLIYFITMRKTYTKLIKKINPKCVFIYFRGL